MSDNITIYKNPSTSAITIRTTRMASTVEKTLTPEQEGYLIAQNALDLAGTIPNPLGAAQEALEEEKQGRYKDREEASRVLQQEKAERAEEREQAQKSLQETKAKLVQANNHLVELLTGNLGTEATEEIINLYAEWKEGLSVDTGDTYRVGRVLYMAICPHVTSTDNSPTSSNAQQYWKGGSIKTDQPAPKPGVAYPKGTVVTYQGVDYYATKDTNSGPEIGYPTWDLLENKPKP
ncbi:MAG: hypothetical protein PT957_03835 [Firmicutes bacterium]|nr:hypothetical protein [Bacillota bacterium]